MERLLQRESQYTPFGMTRRSVVGRCKIYGFKFHDVL